MSCTSLPCLQTSAENLSCSFCHFSGLDHRASDRFQALMQKVTKLGKEVMTLRKEANGKKNVVHSLAECIRC